MAVTIVNYESALMLRQRANQDTPVADRKALYDDNGGHVINSLYRQKFDYELFFYYLDNNVEEVERHSFYEKIKKERQEWESRDLVVDVRESWSQWMRRTSQFEGPPLIPREDLPMEF